MVVGRKGKGEVFLLLLRGKFARVMAYVRQSDEEEWRRVVNRRRGTAATTST